jgi:excreted virulence factor EspC (type VII ESX diderm)
VGYEVDTATLRKVSDEIGSISTGLRSVAGQVAHVTVGPTDFGGDRYQGYGAAYLAGNGDLASLAGRLVGDVDEISRLLREAAGAYDETESDGVARLGGGE